MDTKTLIKKKSNTIILISAILFVIFQAVACVLCFQADFSFDLGWIVHTAVMGIMGFLLYFSYRSHTKNVMKPLMGAALMLLLTYELDIGCYYLTYLKEIFALWNEDANYVVLAITQIIVFFDVIGINIMHYVINASHHSRSTAVRVNHILCILFAILILIECVSFFIILPSKEMLVYNIGNSLAGLGDIFILAIIVCIELSMDEYKLEREKNAE